MPSNSSPQVYMSNGFLVDSTPPPTAPIVDGIWLEEGDSDYQWMDDMLVATWSDFVDAESPTKFYVSAGTEPYVTDLKQWTYVGFALLEFLRVPLQHKDVRYFGVRARNAAGIN